MENTKQMCLILLNNPKLELKQKLKTIKKIKTHTISKITKLVQFYNKKSNLIITPILEQLRIKYVDRLMHLDQIMTETMFFGKEHFDQEMFNVSGLVTYTFFKFIKFLSPTSEHLSYFNSLTTIINKIQTVWKVNPDFFFFTPFEIYTKYKNIYGDEIVFHFLDILERLFTNSKLKKCFNKENNEYLIYQNEIYKYVLKQMPSNSKYQLNPLEIEIPNYFSCLIFEHIRALTDVVILINNPSINSIKNKMIQEFHEPASAKKNLTIFNPERIIIFGRSNDKNSPYLKDLKMESIEYVNNNATATNYLKSVSYQIADFPEKYFKMVNGKTKVESVNFIIKDSAERIYIKLHVEDKLFRMNKRNAFIDIGYLRRIKEFEHIYVFEVPVYQIQSDLNLIVGNLKVTFSKM
jgi:hypothetical protein